MILDLIPHLASKRIILASGSPRRQEILALQGLDFQVVTSSFKEDLPKGDFKDGAEYALATATQKGRDVLKELRASGPDGQPDLVISADTVVQLGAEIMEKPSDAQHAREMLSRLSGNTHAVHTGVVLHLRPLNTHDPQAEYVVRTVTATTNVTFATLDPSLIDAYIETGEPFGKAGAYGIQGKAGSLVSGISGCYFNVMGLPIHDVTAALRHTVTQGLL